MVDKIIEATVRLDGKPSKEIYLDEGRSAFNAQFVGGVNDQTILELLKNCESVRKAVHNI
ncbi:hypothetical protein [uncultured Clostridium sp.]|uniref:hypothetical protein n=1 Tax=uncultured Clostridium sp. TaxID=59620 RepID=UPI0028E8DB3A|nr:hypothetical protein [uncultured Clostridium sp.]